MQKVIDYKLVNAREVEGLESRVKEAMADEWVPSGIVVTYGELLVQAMVKFEGNNS